MAPTENGELPFVKAALDTTRSFINKLLVFDATRSGEANTCIIREMFQRSNSTNEMKEDDTKINMKSEM